MVKIDVYDAPEFVPKGPENEAEAGSPLGTDVRVADEEQIVEALRGIHDPEIPVNIYDLGLIYIVEITPAGEGRGDVLVLMTLTAPGCPVAGEMPQQVAQAVSEVSGVGRVRVRLTWTPPWTPDRMTEVARVALDMF